MFGVLKTKCVLLCVFAAMNFALISSVQGLKYAQLPDIDLSEDKSNFLQMRFALRWRGFMHV